MSVHVCVWVFVCVLYVFNPSLCYRTLVPICASTRQSFPRLVGYQGCCLLWFSPETRASSWIVNLANLPRYFLKGDWGLLLNQTPVARRAPWHSCFFGAQNVLCKAVCKKACALMNLGCILGDSDSAGIWTWASAASMRQDKLWKERQLRRYSRMFGSSLYK